MESSGGEAECSDVPQPQTPSVAVGNLLTVLSHKWLTIFHRKMYEHKLNHCQEVKPNSLQCYYNVCVILNENLSAGLI